MKFALVLALFLVMPFAQAQITNTNDSVVAPHAANPTAPKLWLSIGPGFSTLAAKDTSGASTRTALSVGAELELPLNSNFSVQSGVDYIQKGIAVTDSTAIVALNYFEVPLLAKAKFNLGSAGLAFAAGPYAALAVTREIENEFTSVDASNDVKAFDLGARFGLSLEVPIQEQLSFGLAGNYDLGLVNIAKNSREDSVKNRNFAITAGLGIKL